MNGQTNWAELFLSAGGRAPRNPALVAALVLVGAAALYQAIVGPTLHWLTGWVVYPALFYCGACVLSKRLHDRGRSGWWAALVLIALVAVWSHPNGFFTFLFALILTWAAIELGVLPGEMGANRYGPNPAVAHATLAR